MNVESRDQDWLLRCRPLCAARLLDPRAGEVHGKKLVYLDNAASAQKPNHVLERHEQFRGETSEYANVHRGVPYLADAATEGCVEAREPVRKFLNAGHPERDDLHPRRHRGDEPRRRRHGSRARSRQRRGDRRLRDRAPLQHRAVAFPPRTPRRRDPVGAVNDLGSFWTPTLSRRMIGPRTKLVAISHMSNVLGRGNVARRRSSATTTAREFRLRRRGSRARCMALSTSRR